MSSVTKYERLSSNQGFTLIELLVVMVIIGMLAGLVGPRLFGRVGKSKQAVAQAQIEMLGVALDNYSLDVGQYPTSEQGLQALQVNPNIEGWSGPYLKKEVPLDPWNNPYVYASPGDHGEFDLVSHGADRAPGGEGESSDIVSWKSHRRTL
jgi:general secretion pathway protein G